MNLWLDDIRAPDNTVCEWIWAKTAEDAIDILKEGNVEHISLDHDLGENGMNGYGVACWIERAVFEGSVKMPTWAVHSMNPVGSRNIAAAMERAEEIRGEDV